MDTACSDLPKLFRNVGEELAEERVDWVIGFLIDPSRWGLLGKKEPPMPASNAGTIASWKQLICTCHP